MRLLPRHHWCRNADFSTSFLSYAAVSAVGLFLLLFLLHVPASRFPVNDRLQREKSAVANRQRQPQAAPREGGGSSSSRSLLETQEEEHPGNLPAAGFFVLPLIHRNSPRSPFRKTYSSRQEELMEATERDLVRIHEFATRLQRQNLTMAQRLASSPTTSIGQQNGFRTGVTSGASAGAGQYFIEFAIGTPPQRFLLIADTGSDLIWVRCSDCRRRCPGETQPIFLTRASSSYYAFPCLSQECLLVPPPAQFSCNFRIPSTCRYDYPYADSSDSSGVFSVETISLNSSYGPRTVPNVAFGCGLRNIGQSFIGSGGVLGLGRGSISFASQVGSLVGGKFSYCFADFFHTPAEDSFLVFGELPSSVKVQSPFQYTPFLKNPFAPTFYYVGIQDVRVNGELLSIPSYVWEIDASGNGGTVVDSGTTLSFFVEPAYRQILRAVTNALIYPQVEPVSTFDLCFNASTGSSLTLPRIAISLQDNACFQPPPTNYFIDVPGGLKCLGLQSVDSSFGFSVLGNLIQQNFQMQFDTVNSQLGFAPTVCSQAT